MISLGFIPSQSGNVTVDSYFERNNIKYLASYITVGTGGNVVWENANGEPQYFEGAQDNQTYILGATRILSTAIVDGNTVTTSASNMTWWGINRLENTP